MTNKLWQKYICDTGTYTMVANNIKVSALGKCGKSVKEEGNVVAEYKIGNTRIKVCDNDCREKDSNEIEVILSNIANRVQEQLATQAHLTV